MLDLDGVQCVVMFGMVIVELLGPLLWRYHTDGGLWSIFDLVYGDGMHSSIVVFDIPFDCALTSELEHYYIPL